MNPLFPMKTRPRSWLVRGLSLALLPLMADAVDDLTVQNTTYTTTQTVQADNTITATPAVVVANGADITFQAGTRITLGAGFSVTTGGLFRAQAGQQLPYFSGFETGEGYTTGALQGQRGWMVGSGTAEVSAATTFGGSAGVALLSGGTAASISQGFLASSTPAVTFLDLRLKPVVGSTTAQSSLVQTEAAQVGFQLNGSQGEVFVFDGVGANEWLSTGRRFGLNGSSQASSWLRLTLRLDYTAKKWDLYADGTLIEYDLAFLNNSETYFRRITLQGVTTAATYADEIEAGAINPLFTDADKDGMADSWETAYGLNVSVDDRNGDPDGDGRTNIREFFEGTDPDNADVTNPSVPSDLVNTSMTSASVGLAWGASNDTGAGTTGIAGYNIYRNGTKINGTLVTGTSFVDGSVSAGTGYLYTVRAVDLAGNVSGASASLFVTTSTIDPFEVFTPLPWF